jgi:DNA-binding IclR family transcriptional regulator
MIEQSQKSPIKSARTTLEMLEMIREHQEATLSELTKEFDLSKSSVHNYLSTLQQQGYIIKDGDSYRIALRLLEFGGYARHGEQLYKIGKDKVTELAEETGEMANLLIEENGMGIYLHRAHGAQSVQTDSYIGQRVHLHSTALGKTILANLPQERVDAIIEEHGLPAMTENTVTDRDKLFEELEQVREEGVAYDDEARVKGLRCVAVPVLNNNDKIEGAISLSGPISRFRGETYHTEIPEMLKDAANVIELNITYT